MKKIMALLMAMIMVFSFASCGNEEPEEIVEEPVIEEPAEPEFSSENDYVKIEGICVDNSYVDSEGSPLKMVYLFYTLNANETNLEIDSKYTDLTINDTNTYESDNFVAEACKYMSGYYYSSYIEDVYMGTSIKVAATFKIPEADLAPGRVITLSDHQIPDLSGIRISTNDIIFCSDAKEVAKVMDPEGYADYEYKCLEADEATAKAVKKCINGYYWWFYVNSTYYELEFYSPNKFEVRTSFGNNSGTYSVRNGFIFCTYPSNGYTVEIPYELVGGDIKLHTTEAFDVMG